RDARAALFHVRSHVLGWLSQNLFDRSATWVFKRRAVTYAAGIDYGRFNEGCRVDTAGRRLAIRCTGCRVLSRARARNRARLRATMVAVNARNKTRRFARKRICADQPCAARTILAHRLICINLLAGERATQPGSG